MSACYRTALFFFYCNSCLTFNLCTKVYNQTRSQSRNEINTHTEHLVQKHNDLLSLKRSYLVLNEEKKTRRQERKANRIITLDGKNSKKVELIITLILENFA